MKKYLTIIAMATVMIFCLSSCGKSDYAREQEAKRESIYESGYEDGYDDGYSDAMQEAPERIESCVDSDIWDLESDIEDEWGIHPEEAARMLLNYIDIPGEVTEEELNKAVGAMRRYYFGSHEIINEINDYWID